MVLNSQEPTRVKPTVNPSDRIVISGVSGLYPESRNVKEFSEILYNKINPVIKQENRWNYDHPEVAQYLGTLHGLTKFDAHFFKVTYRQGNVMDAMSRKILEQTYQAIYDAGVNPNLLSGKQIGVYVGVCFSEADKTFYYDPSIRTGLGVSGCSKAKFANRVSYWLNARGPSMAVDEGCCSSTCALELAYMAMTRGDCEMAVVAGSNLCLHPQTSILQGRVLKTCPDGKTKSFDANADGCAKSEAINVVFLQKAKDALRIYADLVHVKCEFTGLCSDETGPIYGFYRSSEEMANFIKEFYDEVDVSPKAVEYVEAVGSAIPEVDKAELEAISEFFCKDRIDPLLVGSVMSNIGYTEAASGLSALTKVILGYETGKIAANLHCDSPRQDIAALREGKIRLITDHTDFGRSYTAINGLSITGANSHILLNGCYKPKVSSRYKSNIPYLITLSGRYEPAVAKIINDLKSRPIDPEEVALLHNIHEAKISGHLGRGYVILDTEELSTTISLCEKVESYDDTKRPLWFVYSGMGSQWSGMGKQLLRIPAFAAAIEKCKRILEPRGIDIIDVICSNDKTIFNNVQNTFVGIAAIQIGLTDVLKELDIKPDKIIGHSVGELGCAYADGCFTVEEMILAAFGRGQASLETPLIHGAMAAVGLGYKQIVQLCPPGIEVACHNSSKTCTISGPVEMIHEFVKVLVRKGIFAKEVPCSNIAYHSRYIADAGPNLLKILRKLIKSPKPRSKRWISSSVPMNRWDEPLAKYSSAEYHTNNLLSPVLFEEASRLIPPNAVLIEIAPHGLLQAILKRSFPSCHHVPLTRRGYTNAVEFFLQAIGRLYIDGFNPKIRALYPKIEFPVSTGTRPLSHLVEWVHNENWHLESFVSAQKQKASACNYVISTHDDDNSYLRGHVIRGKNLFPFAAALVLVWDTYAMTLSVEKKKLSVQFRDVHVHSEPLLHDQRQLRLNINIHRSSGRFEVMDENIKVVSGYITAYKTNNRILEVNSKFHDNTQLCSKDIYQLLHTSGYSYTDGFRSLHNSNFSLTEAEIIWQNNWVTFIDGMLQLNALRCSHKMTCVPEALSQLTIDVENHFNYILNTEEQSILAANIFQTHDCIKCGGVIIEHMKYQSLPPLNQNAVSLKAKKFVPQFPTIDSDDVWEGEYILPLQEKYSPKNNMMLKCARAGDFDSIHWIEAPQNDYGGINVNVHFAGINLVYVNEEVGIVHSLTTDGQRNFKVDFSGITEGGYRVMGIVPDQVISTQVKAQLELLWPVPDHWSLEDAATVPLAYCIAFYCLIIKTQLSFGQRILIHGGVGALGQALISIALAFQCEVFVTVSSIRKKQFLQKLFPQLQDDHIGNSCNHSFGDMVLNATKGEGCDVIVSCVQGELKNTTLKCCAAYGITLDIIQLLSREDFNMGMYYLTKSRSYATINFSTIFENSEQLLKLQALVSEGIARGYVRPLSRVTFTSQEAPRAFRLLIGRRQRGRVLLDLRHYDLNAVPRLRCASDMYQVILSKDEEFGIQLVEKLASRGAQNIYLYCEKISNILLFKQRSWEEDGLNIKVSQGNINQANLVDLINGCVSQGNIKGAVEGLYLYDVISYNLEIDKSKEIILKVKKLHPKLNQFAIINSNFNTDEQINMGRSQEPLPVWILLPALDKLDKSENRFSSDKNISPLTAVDAVEKALCSKQSVVIASKVTVPHVPLMQAISKIAGINIDDNNSKTDTLKDLGIDLPVLETIRAYLHHEYNLSLTNQDMSSLTLKTLKDLERNVMQINYTEDEGLKSFFLNINSDEIQASTDIVFLPTLTNAITSNCEFDKNQACMCIVPGVEGHFERFRVLCELLKLPALVLQPGLNNPQESINDLAKRYSQVLLKKTGLHDKFFLLGYESGVIIAIKLAEILEAHGLLGTVFCIGGSPDDIKAHFQKKLSIYKDEVALQNAILQHTTRLMMKNADESINDKLETAVTWNEKVLVCLRIMKETIQHSSQYVKQIIESAYAKVSQVLQYEPMTVRLRSNIVSLRPTTNSPTTMQKYSEQPVIEYSLSTPLAYMTQDLQCSAIINRHIGDNILEQFNKRNLCEMYSVSSVNFSK